MIKFCMLLCCVCALTAVVPDTFNADSDASQCGTHCAAQSLHTQPGQNQDDSPDDGDLANVQLLQQEVRVEQTPLVEGSATILETLSHSKDVHSAGATILEKLSHSKDVHSSHSKDVHSAAPTTTTLPPTGVTMNAVGDLTAFISALLVNGFMVVFSLLLFSCVLRPRFPSMYEHNVITKVMPEEVPETTFGWVRASMNLDIEMVAENISLDHALMLKFANLCLKMSGVIALPMICIMGSMNCAFGENAAGEDHMSYLSFGNVKNGSWLYYIHALVIWAVVLFIVRSINAAHREFMRMRFKWLRELPDSRANTVMVENIPEGYQSDEELKKFIAKLLPFSTIESCYVAKDTSVLGPLVASLNKAKHSHREAELKWQKSGERPKVRESMLGARVDAMDFYQNQIAELEKDVKEERKRIQEAKSTTGGVNTSSGFITFDKRADAEITLRMDGVSELLDEWTFDIPPHPADVIWSDLTQSAEVRDARENIGFLCVAGLVFAYMPIVIGVTNIAKLINMGFLQPLWSGLAPTIGLQLMVAFLPTLLLLIFNLFFPLKGSTFAQHKLQTWYFWFQIFFVVLITAVGQNFTEFTKILFQDPLSIFEVMATTMPYATHFYMNFLVLQWVTHAMNICRAVQLFKYLMFSRLWEPEEAREKAEPEDQDYYGIGGRSARWSITMVICIVYGTLSPPVNLLTFINFLIIRLVYGYLFCFAESKKTDMGGAFWVSQMQQLFTGLIIYTILMVGVLYYRATYSTPAFMALPMLFYVIYQMKQFKSSYAWEKLPFEELMSSSEVKKKVCEDKFVQPELLD